MEDYNYLELLEDYDAVVIAHKQSMDWLDELKIKHHTLLETAKELHEALTEAQALIYGTEGEQPYTPLLASSRKVLNAA